jgi:hypothetical protein
VCSGGQCYSLQLEYLAEDVEYGEGIIGLNANSVFLKSLNAFAYTVTEELVRFK